MLDFESLFYIVIIVLFAVSFVPRRIRVRAAEALRAGAVFAAPRVTYALRNAASSLSRAIKAIVIELVEPAAYRVVTGLDPHARKGDRFVSYDAQQPASAAGGDTHPPVQHDFPLLSAKNADLHDEKPTVESGDIAPATAEEVQALARALRHNHTSADKTKSGAIKAGWGLSRSGTDPRYRRASQLYDLATRPPERFPPLTADKQRATSKPSRVGKSG